MSITSPEKSEGQTSGESSVQQVPLTHLDLLELPDEDLISRTLELNLLSIPDKTIAADDSFTDNVFMNRHFKEEARYYKSPTEEEEKLTLAALLKAYVYGQTGSLPVSWLVSRGVFLLPTPADSDDFLFRATLQWNTTTTEELRKISVQEPIPWFTTNLRSYFPTESSSTLKDYLEEVKVVGEGTSKAQDEKLAGEVDTAESESEQEGVTLTTKNQFYTWAKGILLEGNRKSPSYQYLKVLLGYSHLVFMRFLVKDTKSVMGAWGRQVITNHLSSLYKVENVSGIPLFAPDARYHSQVYTNMNILHDDIRQVFLWSLSLYLTANTSTVTKINSFKSVISAGFLSHTSMNGLGTIDHFQSLAYLSSVNPDELLNYFDVSNFQTSAERVIRFLSRTKGNFLWKWCRIVRNNYFANMAVKSNLDFCVYLASALSEGSKDQGIWSSVALQGANPVIKEQAKEWAIAFWECVTPSNTERLARRPETRRSQEKVATRALKSKVRAKKSNLGE